MSARTAFTTSRLLEFCTVAELTKLVGAPPEVWPLVAVKELVDNALDACEEAGIAPEITIAVSTENGTLYVADNGPGIAPETVTNLLDFHQKTSSREAYVAPTRGAQGNALQGLLAMPFGLHGSEGKTVIETRGVAHNITFAIDPVRREPKIEHVQSASFVQSGTRVTLHWPSSASSKLADCHPRIVQVICDFAWFNPHAAFTLQWDGKKDAIVATNPRWVKWRPSEAAPAAWYDAESFNRLIAACVADDQDHGRDRTVREFIAEFRGCARTDVQKQLLDTVAASRMLLKEFFENPERVKKLLACMQEITKPLPARELGLLGRDHFLSRLSDAGADLDTFQYRRALCEVDGVPYALEAAFGWCPEGHHQQIVGVNWSPSLINPFRRLSSIDRSLDALLEEQRAGKDDEPIILALHLASPRIAYSDKAKSALILPNAVADKLVEVVWGVTKNWARVRKAEERDASAQARRRERLIRSRRESIKDVAYDVMERAYNDVSDNGELPANARQIMYAARNEIQERTEKQLNDAYFTQTLLPDFVNENPKLTASWDVVYDDRGHFTEPHTGHMIGLGTLSVREYIDGTHPIQIKHAGFAPAEVVTRGPHGGFGALLYIEKEGFDPLLERVQLADRFDIGTMSSKGMSVTAARKLADEICHAYRIPLLLLHDFDKSGFSIKGSFERRAARRYTFENAIKVIDLGLRLNDVRGLQREDVFDRGSEEKKRANLRANGATPEEIEILLKQRVELNAMTSRQFVAFLERKLIENGIRKIIPAKSDLATAYRAFAQGREVEKIIKRALRKLNGSATPVPADLKAKVEHYLRQHPAARWDEAVAAIASMHKVHR